MSVTRPGFYRDITAEEYHKDPCPVPSLSQSIAKLLIHHSPLHAWTNHSRLNPDWQESADKKFDLGSAAHKLLIGAGKNIAILEHDDYRTNKAKDAREAAIAERKTPILAHQYVRAQRMVAAAREQLELRNGELGCRLFDPEIGSGELVMVWQEREVWARQMLDWLSDDHLIYADYKTTQESAAPHMLGRKASNDGWYIQAAMAERGLNWLQPEKFDAGRVFYFVVQEIEPPYCLSVAQVDEDWLARGREQLAYAFDRWADCLKQNLWPGYPLDTIHPAIPAWFDNDWLTRAIQASAQQRSGIVTEIV